jgi:hypothetical protein
MKLERRRQILISYGILAGAALLALATIILPPIASRMELLASIDASIETYARSIDAMERMAEAASSASMTIDDMLLYHADTDALAAADLQQSIADLVDQHGGSLVSTAHRRNSTESPLKMVPVAVRLRSSVASLVDLLLAIEEHRPRLFVSDLLIQSRHRPGRPLQDVNDELDVQFDVVGYLAPQAGSP